MTATSHLAYYYNRALQQVTYTINQTPEAAKATLLPALTGTQKQGIVTVQIEKTDKQDPTKMDVEDFDPWLDAIKITDFSPAGS